MLTCSLCWVWACSCPLSHGTGDRRRQAGLFSLRCDSLWRGFWDRPHGPQGRSPSLGGWGGKEVIKMGWEQPCALCGIETLLSLNASGCLYCSASCLFLFLWKCGVGTCQRGGTELQPGFCEDGGGKGEVMGWGEAPGAPSAPCQARTRVGEWRLPPGRRRGWGPQRDPGATSSGLPWDLRGSGLLGCDLNGLYWGQPWAGWLCGLLSCLNQK